MILFILWLIIQVITVKGGDIVYTLDGNKIDYPWIIGDGVSDDTDNLQMLVDNYHTICFSEPKTIKITSTITIDVSKLTMFDGGNSTFIIDGDFAGFEIVGDSESSYKKVIPSDFWTNQYYINIASFTFKNCKIKSADGVSGIGLKLIDCAQVNVKNCLFRGMNTAILLDGIGRNIIIDGCHLWYLTGSGIEFADTSNTHQININNNHISFCKYGVFVNNPQEIANWQFCGNDVELNTYPLSEKENDRAIYIYSDNTKSSQMSEFEICGNTIQGHELSDCIIEIHGGNNRYIEHTSLVGNHISNVLPNGILVIFDKCRNMTICNNTFKDEKSSSESAYSTTCITIANSKGIAIVGNSFFKVKDFISITSNSEDMSISANAGECIGTFAYNDNTCSNIVQIGNAITENQ